MLYNDLSKAFYKTNNDLYEENVGNNFVTCWLGKINMKSNELSFVNAGHNSPLIKLNNNDFEYMKVKPGLVLAAMKDVDYKTHIIPFKKEDTIFLYTDGVTEANDDYKVYKPPQTISYFSLVSPARPDAKERSEIFTL